MFTFVSCRLRYKKVVKYNHFFSKIVIYNHF
nr:MAG TPA: hypothetical protein [Crassvirales sp.]